MKVAIYMYCLMLLFTLSEKLIFNKRNKLMFIRKCNVYEEGLEIIIINRNKLEVMKFQE